LRFNDNVPLDLKTAADLRDELQWIAAGGTEAIAPLVPARKYPMAWIAAGLFAVIALFGWMRPRTTPTTANWKLSIIPPNSVELLRVDSPVATPAISPDGSALVFLSSPRLLYLRRMEAPEAIPLRGTESAIMPFWSPNGRSIAFFDTDRLMKMRVPDGARSDHDGPSIFSRRNLELKWNDPVAMATSGEGVRLHTVPATGESLPGWRSTH
jgi:hypothetical protein